mmetsp:Transcript_9384/g.14295  ORF Transcript_9384/g.14295 Transcript_9384/m.14295 type:complete len:373 (+) Transcript_9384:1776-2894(+)
MRDKEYNTPKMSTLIISQKAPVVVERVQGFNSAEEIEFEKRTGHKFKICLFVKISKVISALLFTISTNFYRLSRDPFIYLLEDTDFKTVLKHKRLNVSSENEIIEGLNFWLQDPSRSMESIGKVLPEINWKFVPLCILLELNRSHPKMRESLEFKKMFGSELKHRLLFATAAHNRAINNVERYIKDLGHPRFCYKTSKVHNMIITDFAKDELEALPIYEDLPEISKMVINHNINFIEDFISIQLSFGQSFLPPSPVADFKMQLAIRSADRPPTQKQQDELRSKLASIVLAKQNEIQQLMEQLHILGLNNTEVSLQREEEQKREEVKRNQADEIDKLKFDFEREKILNEMKALKTQNDRQQEILRLRQENAVN